MLKRLFAIATHRIYSLPVIVLMPHSRCNCRCIMCDIWKANHEKRELPVEELERHLERFGQLGVREVVFSGGEALMYGNLWKLCVLLKERGISLTLLSTGLLLQKHASAITEFLDAVIVSVDGSEEVHDRIRNIEGGFSKLAAGVRELKQINPAFRVTARCVLQRYNFFDFVNIVRSSQAIGLDRISFLAADISTSAFNRVSGWSEERVSEVALNREETLAFESIVEQSFTELASEYNSGFIAESPSKMKRIVQYYKALNGMTGFPVPVCNAPWVSVVIETDGSVLPCFFHKPYGNIYERDFLDVINSPEAIRFRKTLDMRQDPVCKKCVCSLKLGVWQRL